LTFATCLAASSQRECQILNSTENIHLLVVLKFYHSQKWLLSGDTNVRIGPHWGSATPDRRLQSIGMTLMC
jgi:hypothetical protein